MVKDVESVVTDIHDFSFCSRHPFCYVSEGIRREEEEEGVKKFSFTYGFPDFLPQPPPSHFRDSQQEMLSSVREVKEKEEKLKYKKACLVSSKLHCEFTCDRNDESG